MWAKHEEERVVPTEQPQARMAQCQVLWPQLLLRLRPVLPHSTSQTPKGFVRSCLKKICIFFTKKCPQSGIEVLQKFREFRVHYKLK